MRSLELDIKKIAQIGKQKERENIRFRAFLKGQDSERIDEIVHRLDKEIRTQINCQDFENQFVEIDGFEGIKYLKNTPCIFLKDKSCSIYTDRPEDCKSFPHTHKDDFTARLFVTIENYGICPIVFNVFERLKRELGFR